MVRKLRECPQTSLDRCETELKRLYCDGSVTQRLMGPNNRMKFDVRQWKPTINHK